MSARRRCARCCSDPRCAGTSTRHRTRRSTSAGRPRHLAVGCTGCAVSTPPGPPCGTCSASSRCRRRRRRLRRASTRSRSRDVTTSVARTSRGATALATAMWGLYICGWIATLALRVAAHVAAWDSLMIAFTAFATVGWLVAVRSPRTPIGWLFLGIGVMTALGVVTDGVVQLALARGWSSTGFVMFSAWVQLWFWYSLLVMSTAMTMLLFPAGLPSRRWRPVLVLLVVAALLMTVMAALSPDVDFGKAKLPNPIGVASNVKK